MMMMNKKMSRKMMERTTSTRSAGIARDDPSGGLRSYELS